MKPTDPPEPQRTPREFAERAGAVLAERMEPQRAAEPTVPPKAGAVAPAASSTPPAKDVPCALCDSVAETSPVTNASAAPVMTTLAEYRTAQRELLGHWLVATHAGFDASAPMHAACLHEAERAMQGAQLVREDGRLYFVDITLGSMPILPTPIRMGADLRFEGRGVTIAFIDSGYYPHIDFTRPHDRIVAMYDAVRDRELRSTARLVRRDPPVQAWHGTMAAATAAGSGCAAGGVYRGIASEARLVFIRAMTGSYRIRTPQVVRALEWIRDHRETYDIRVVNMSVGVDETTDSMAHPVIALVEELSASGVVMVAASGNNPMRPIKPPGAAPSAITVGGYNDHNSTEWMRRELWHGSYGNTPGGGRKPELLAPSIWVAAPILPRTGVKREAEALFELAAADDAALMFRRAELAVDTKVSAALLEAETPMEARSVVLARIAAEKMITEEYKHVDGTSFAAPIVSSVVAQMLEARPELTPGEVKAILCATADLLPNVPAEAQGYGVVNPGRALAAVVGSAPATAEPRMRAAME